MWARFFLTWGENPCVLNLEVGTGSASLPRWYYNVLTQQCAQFSYQGLRGNQNDFLSKQDCEKTCRGDIIKWCSNIHFKPGPISCLVFANPCSQGEPVLGPDSMPVKCGSAGSSNCPRSYWCHFGDTVDTTVCCPGGNWSSIVVNYVSLYYNLMHSYFSCPKCMWTTHDGRFW